MDSTMKICKHYTLPRFKVQGHIEVQKRGSGFNNELQQHEISLDCKENNGHGNANNNNNNNIIMDLSV